MIRPSADDLARMSWHARERLMRRLAAEHRPPVERTPQPIVILHPKPKSVRTVADMPDAEWAEQEREMARQMLAALPVDPDAAEHRRVAYKAAYGHEVSWVVAHTFRLAVAA